VYTSQNRFIFTPHSFCKGNMNLFVGFLKIGSQTELSETSHDIEVFFLSNQAVVLHSISNQIFDRNDFQIKFFSYYQQLRKSSHRSVFVENFNQNSGWL